jgi:aldehyde dehydrogenase (NAD+)
VTNPYNGSVVAEGIHAASTEDIDIAVAAAEAALKTGPWATFTGKQRAKCLLNLADLVERDAVKLAQLETACTGISSATFSILAPWAVESLRYNAGLAHNILGTTLPVENGLYVINRKQPYGVVACIGAYNMSFGYLAHKVGPAVAAGNTVCALN